MKQEIGIYFWVRVGVMLFTLAGVLLLMQKLKSSEGLFSASSDKVDICPTRVSSISVIGRFAIMQEGLKWYRTKEGERTELDPIAVEKWFGINCKVSAEKIASPVETKDPVVTFAYVAGLPATLMTGENGAFALNKSHFRSPQLAQAILDLETLPAPTMPGQNKTHP